MPRILAIVVGYKPLEALLSQSIASYALHVEKVLLWQNSPITFEHPKVELCGDGTNRGIGPALNYARQRVLSEGYDYLSLWIRTRSGRIFRPIFRRLWRLRSRLCWDPL